MADEEFRRLLNPKEIDPVLKGKVTLQRTKAISSESGLGLTCLALKVIGCMDLIKGKARVKGS